MSATTERVRAELEAQTGVDFARYRDDTFIDTVTGWSGLVGIAIDLMVAVGVGAVVVVAHVMVAAAGSLGAEAAIGLTVGGLVSSVGVAVATFALRLRRRIPTEADKVFVVSAAMADRVASDLGSGNLRVTPSQAARGMALVAAVPAMIRIAQRRFPFFGTVAAPIAGAVLTRALTRAWPETTGGEAITGLEGTALRLEGAVEAARQAVVPRLSGVVRWATLPLILAGGTTVALGMLLTGISIATS